MPQHGGVNGLGASVVELHLSGITSIGLVTSFFAFVNFVFALLQRKF